MASIVWDESYHVGIDEIDLQHQRLFEILNELQDCGFNRHEDCVNKAFDDLFAYVLVHFNTEEKIMKKLGYPALAAHESLHADLKNRVLDYRQRLEAGEKISIPEVVGFVLNWLTNHIKTQDTPIGGYQKHA